MQRKSLCNTWTGANASYATQHCQHNDYVAHAGTQQQKDRTAACTGLRERRKGTNESGFGQQRREEVRVGLPARLWMRIPAGV